MRALSAIVAGCLALATVAGAAQGRGVGELVEQIVKLFGREEGALARIGGKAAADRALSRMALSEEYVARLGSEEAGQLEAAILKVAARDPAQVEPLKEVLKLVLSGTRPLDKTAPFDAAMPFLRIRATGIPIYDDALAAFARARLEPTLKQRFSVEDLRVIPFGMSENAAESAREIEQYRHVLSIAHRDEVGPLARLARGELGELDAAGKRAALGPYRGKTVILVGHMPESDARFVVWQKGELERVDLSGWMEAASSAEVNLVPIGCNSGYFLPFGASDFVNSASVLERLALVIHDQPRTVQEFYTSLTGEDLGLLLDPTKLRMFDNTAEITRRETNELVGRVATNLKLQTPYEVGRLFEILARPSYPDYEKCFAGQDSVAFDGCAANVKRAFELESEVASEPKKRVDVRQQREQIMKRLPQALQAAAAAEKRALRILVLWTLCYIVVWLIAALAAPYSHIVWSVEEAGEPPVSMWRAITDPRIVKKLMPLAFTRDYWRDVSRSGLMLPWLPLLMGVGLFGVALWGVCNYDDEWLSVMGPIAVYVCGIQVFWAGIGALRANAGPTGIAFLLMVLGLGAALKLFDTADVFASAHQQTGNLAALSSSLANDNPMVWRAAIDGMPWRLSEDLGLEHY